MDAFTSLQTSQPFKLDSLYHVLSQCFGLILLGYITGRFGLINEANSKGLSNFVTYISLPALVFLEIVETNFLSIDWTFVGCIFLAKVLIFSLVSLVTLIITHPTNYGKAGLYGLFCTQSNDFALGYPLLYSLYNSIDHKLASYAYVLAPLQLTLINPIAFLMMEYENSLSSTQSNVITQSSPVYINVFKKIFKNPIILVTILGVVWNLAFGNHIHHLLASFLKVLSEAFFSTALFIIGLFLVGKFKFLQSSHLMTPCTLTIVKLFILPLLFQSLIELFVKRSAYSSVMSSFGYIYGIIPTAPTIFVFALQYGLSTWIISTGLIICTIVSAPLILISSYIIKLNFSSFDFDQEISSSIEVVSKISIFFALITLIIFIVKKNFRILTFRCTLFIIVSQLIISLSGFLKNFSNSSSFHDLNNLLYFFGSFSSYIWTVILILVLTSLYCKSLCFTLKYQHFITFLATFNIFLLIILSFFYHSITQFLNRIYLSFRNFDYLFLILDLVIILMILTFLIFQARNEAKSFHYQLISESNLNVSLEEQTLSSSSNLISTPSSHSLSNKNNFPNVENLVESSFKVHCDNIEECCTQQQKKCLQNLTSYQATLEDQDFALLANSITSTKSVHQLPSHILFLLMIFFSNLINLSVSIKKMFNEKPSGISFELEFLNVLLKYGQPITSFIIFGLDGAYLACLFSKFKTLLPNVCYSWFDNSSPTNKDLIQEFKEVFLCRCKKEIKYTIVPNSNTIGAFKGSDLIHWLIKNHIVPDKQSGIRYATTLLTFNIISYQAKYLHFNDSCLYHFTCSDFIKFNNLKSSNF